MLLLIIRCLTVLGGVLTSLQLDLSLLYVAVYLFILVGALVRVASFALLCATIVSVAQYPQIWDLARPGPLQAAACLIACLLVLLGYGAGRYSLDHRFFHIESIR